MEPCHYLHGVMHPEPSILQHGLEGATHLQDCLPCGCFAHSEEVAHVAEAGGCGQFQQGDGLPGVCGQRQPHGGVLLLQVQVELLKDVLECGPGCME